mmetsp:Transcript_29549/g.71088  ORF Transcript_29549/g.71088 Transcript_29549/m.71088 type:complete len:535 (+) Transcript_29549:50-1654(+)
MVLVKSNQQTCCNSSSMSSSHNSNSNGNGNGKFSSVLQKGFQSKAFVETSVQKVLPKAGPEEIHELASSLIRFLELKVVLQEYSSEPESHLLAATPLLEQAWLALYEDCKLYPQVITAIQGFHGQPQFHVYLRRSSPTSGGVATGLNAKQAATEEGPEDEAEEQSAFSILTTDQEYLNRLARTQSLMQCYYNTTMPNSLKDLELLYNQNLTLLPTSSVDIPNTVTPKAPKLERKKRVIRAIRPIRTNTKMCDEDMMTMEQGLFKKAAPTTTPEILDTENQSQDAVVPRNNNKIDPSEPLLDDDDEEDTAIEQPQQQRDFSKVNSIIATAPPAVTEEETVVDKPDDIPSVVVPENDSTVYSSDDSSGDSDSSSDYTSDSEEEVSYTSSLTNSTGLANQNSSSFCHMFSLLCTRSFCNKPDSTTASAYSSYKDTDYAKEPAQQPVARQTRKRKQRRFLEMEGDDSDMTLSETDSENSPTAAARNSASSSSNNKRNKNNYNLHKRNNHRGHNNNTKRGKKRYQKLNRRWEDFKCYWV